MDEEFAPTPSREESVLEKGFAAEKEDSQEEIGEYDSDLSDEGHEGSSERTTGWGSLPDVCLRHVFRFLPYRDRRSSDLVCHHWHSVMRSPSLWRSRVFHFSGRLSKFRQSELISAVAYARSLGVYLERLEVSVCPPRRSLVAQRLEQTISGLLSELTRVKAPLQSLSLMKLELDRTSWTAGLRESLVNSLILFIRRGGSKLTSVCLSGMQNCLHHGKLSSLLTDSVINSKGLELLSALAHPQRRFYTRCNISSLDLQGFFSTAMHSHLNPSVPHFLHHLPGLTDLSLSYSCLSDELLMALQHRHRGNSRRVEITLQTLSLHCTLNEPYRQLVSGSSWATLASRCPDLKVKLIVEQVINTNWLARVLLPEIPLTEYTMTAFYSPDEDWSAKPLLRDMLPWYRHSLQQLTLDLSYCSESLDEALLELVKVCERLEQLTVWAFLSISTVGRLLHIRLTQRSLLNKIRVRIYSANEDNGEQEDQLEVLLSSHLHLPPELEFSVKVYPFFV